MNSTFLGSILDHILLGYLTPNNTRNAMLLTVYTLQIKDLHNAIKEPLLSAQDGSIKILTSKCLLCKRFFVVQRVFSNLKSKKWLSGESDSSPTIFVFI